MRKTTVFLLFFLAVVLTALFCLVVVSYPKKEIGLFEKENALEKDCFTVEEDIVNGISLSGIVENGQTVKILFGYYNCNEIKRGDIVVYNYAGNKNPIIKIAKGLPGDRFSLKKTEDLPGWNIVINGEILANSENRPYLFNERRHKMLSLYERDYKGIVPENSYLLLGNVASGSVDSTVFGLVHKSDIVGKVEW